MTPIETIQPYPTIFQGCLILIGIVTVLAFMERIAEWHNEMNRIDNRNND